MKKKRYRQVMIHAFLILFGFTMVYPLIWLFFSSFKPSSEILGSIALLPKNPVWDSYLKGWRGSVQYTYTTFFLNTFKIVIPVVLFTLISSTFVGYSFARFEFPLKRILFLLMISMLMLPSTVLIIPRYIMFRNFGWLDSYLPFIVPSLFATTPFFNFMMVQFFRGIPRELDEAAKIDGCNSFAILVEILLPNCKAALISAGLFQFIWTWNDFFNTLVYVNSVRKFPLSLALRMSIDTSGVVAWNEVIAMSLVAVLPCIVIYFTAQKYFVEGVTMTGLKG